MEVVAEAYPYTNNANDMMSFQYNTYNYGFSLFHWSNFTPVGYKIGSEEIIRSVCIIDNNGM